MPYILYSYIIAEIAGPFWAALAILSGVMFAGKIMKMVDMIFQLNIGLGDFLRLVAYLAPNQLLFSIPMAATLAVLIAFTRMSNDNEIIALKAAGLNIYRLLPPVVIFALAVALLSGVISTQFIPAGRIAMAHLITRLATEKVNNGVQAKRFSEGTGNMVLYVDKVDPESRRWQGVYLSDVSDQENPATVIAQRGGITPHMDQAYVSIDLEDGTMRRTAGETEQTVDFKRYQVEIPVAPMAGVGSGKKREEDKNRLYQGELLRQAARVGPDSTMGRAFLVEYHLRLVFAVGTFIMAVLGLPLALRSKGGRRNFGIPLGLGFFILYFIAITAAKNISATGTMPVGLVMWLPNIGFGIITGGILIITAKEKWHLIMAKFL